MERASTTHLRDSLEAKLRELLDAGEFDAALTSVLSAYGEEVYAFLLARLQSEDDAADVFAQAAEDMFRSFSTFEGRASLRTWFYRLARTAAARHLRTPHVRGRAALSQVSELVAQVRSQTVAHLRTDMKDRVRALRAQLDADSEQLLVLRIDHGLEWDQIAEILCDDLEDAEKRRRASARLRQQFKKVKDRLRDMAIEEGLLDPDAQE